MVKYEHKIEVKHKEDGRINYAKYEHKIDVKRREDSTE